MRQQPLGDRAGQSASGTSAGGSQSETCPSSVWPHMYSSSWMWPIGKSKPPRGSPQ